MSDIPAALGLLTRLPIPVDTDKATARGADAAWAYPAAGLLVAFIAASLASLGLKLGLPTAIAAMIALAASIIVTGAMHEDGLADCADGLWGGWTAERRLAIMKDSQIGAYGTLALIFSLLARYTAFTVLIYAGLLWPALIASAVLSRAAMVVQMSVLPNARNSGLSQSMGRPGQTTALLAGAIALVVCAITLGIASAFILALVVTAITLICNAIAVQKISGQTGDTLGATQQLSEISCLFALTALVS